MPAVTLPESAAANEGTGAAGKFGVDTSNRNPLKQQRRE